MSSSQLNPKLTVREVKIGDLKSSEYNPRRWPEDAIEQLTKSIKAHGLVEPILINSSPNRRNVVIGGHFRIRVAQDLGFKEIPAVAVSIPDIEVEKALNIRLNKALGEFDFTKLADFAEDFLADVGFSSEEIDDIFPEDENPEVFDLEKQLAKLDIKNIEIKKGDVWRLGDHRLKCGDSTVEADVLDLMNGEKAAMCLTDPPYILDYLKGKKRRNGEATTGFGYKRDRRYLETESLPDDFTELWMANVHAVQQPDFSVMVYENWKNIREIWNEMEKYWKVKNMVVWHLPNRVQGFSAKYKFFNKHDISIVGGSGNVPYNHTDEGPFQEEYETALFAIAGKPTWEGYEKGKRIQPTDFIEYVAADEKSSGQGVIFGTKPVEILIPYMKVLTKRGDIVIEPFCGSGSTMIAAQKLKRRCYTIEKSPVYAEVARHRWEKLTGKKAVKL